MYVSIFEKDNNLYPIEILVEKHIPTEKDTIHFIVVMDKIKKEVLPTTGGQHAVETPRISASKLPYTISLPVIVSNFKKEHSLLLKHFPDEMLSEKQLVWKNRAIKKDLKKDGFVVDDDFKLINTQHQG